MWPQGCPVSVRVARASCGLLSNQYSANRPHLGLGPETPCSSLVATRISGCIQSSPGESGLFSSGIKNSVLLSSCDRYLLEPIECPKGCQASCGVVREYSGLLSRHWKKRNASSRDDGENLLFFFSCCTTCGVSLELRWETQGASRVAPGCPVSIRFVTQSTALFSTHNSVIGSQDTLKVESRGLSRVATRIPGLPQLVTVN